MLAGLRPRTILIFAIALWCITRNLDTGQCNAPRPSCGLVVQEGGDYRTPEKISEFKWNGSQGALPLGGLPLWGSEGVTLQLSWIWSKYPRERKKNSGTSQKKELFCILLDLCRGKLLDCPGVGLARKDKLPVLHRTLNKSLPGGRADKERCRARGAADGACGNVCIYCREIRAAVAAFPDTRLEFRERDYLRAAIGLEDLQFSLHVQLVDLVGFQFVMVRANLAVADEIHIQRKRRNNEQEPAGDFF